MCLFKSVIVACLCLAAIFVPSVKTHFGFTKSKSWIFYEPPVGHSVQRTNDVTEHYFTQSLDNFDPQNIRTFQMQYLKNERHFKSGGPIFLMVGGEWRISAGHILPGQHIYDLAKEFGGLLVYTEHRYYGKSRPTDTISTADLKYLSVDQSLADLAHFIINLTSNEVLNATGGVIMVGGSYAGTMVTWFRQKYPHLVNGVWASSAPLHAKVDFFEYKEVVGKSILEVGSRRCYEQLRTNFQITEKLMKNGEMKELRTLFKMCSDFDETNELDVWNFHGTLADILSYVVQRHRSGDIEMACKEILNGTESDNTANEIDQLRGFAEFVHRKLETQNAKCIDFNYHTTIKELTDEQWSEIPIRQWLYQTCSEFGWYQTSTSQDQPFGSTFPIDFYLHLCNDMFGKRFSGDTMSTKVDRKNHIYGGINPKVRNVFFTHGSIDPWHRMGILSDLNEHSPAAFIPGASHCNDLQSINFQGDSREMLLAKVTVRNLVKKWLNQ